MPFSSRTLRFLRDLSRHNERPWFETHRADYEAAVKEPLHEFVEEMDVRLARIAPEIVGVPKTSVFRIYRDIRFSNDKSPYKTHASCWFFHRDGSRSVGREAAGGGAGFYFQIAPGQSFMGGGMWRPAREGLAKIRDAIAENPVRFAKIVNDKRVVRRFKGLTEEDMLKRVPRGYGPDHPAAKWLRFQSFTLGRDLTDAQAVSAKLPALLEADYRLIVPLVRFINGALGLKPAAKR